jgi:hypothetical protein
VHWTNSLLKTSESRLFIVLNVPGTNHELKTKGRLPVNGIDPWKAQVFVFQPPAALRNCELLPSWRAETASLPASLGGGFCVDTVFTS